MPKQLQFTKQGYLKPGIYILRISELEEMFVGGNLQRISLFQKLRLGLKNLKKAGVKNVYIDGSFVTTKEEPNNIDGCWA